MLETVIWDVMAFSTSLLFLGYSAYHDLKKREVPDKVWLFYAPPAAFFTIIRLMLGSIDLGLTLLSILITTGLSLSVFYLGIFGGGDAKALICLGLALPTYPFNLNSPLGRPHPLYPIATFYNAYFFSILIIAYTLARNISWSLRSRGSLFEGLEDESLPRKVLALMTGFKVDVKVLDNNSHLYPMEKIIEGERGVKRRLSLNIDIEADGSGQMKGFTDAYRKEGIKAVWVTPGLPLLLFIVLSSVFTLFIGDMLAWIAFRLTTILA